MEQAKGHTGNNIVTVLMKARGTSLQETSDYIGTYFAHLMDELVAAKAAMPSWGAAVDEEVAQYVRAMEHWVIGNIRWSFETQRYFGPTHDEVRQTLCVVLRPRDADDDEVLIHARPQENALTRSTRGSRSEDRVLTCTTGRESAAGSASKKERKALRVRRNRLSLVHRVIYIPCMPSDVQPLNTHPASNPNTCSRWNRVAGANIYTRGRKAIDVAHTRQLRLHRRT